MKLNKKAKQISSAGMIFSLVLAVFAFCFIIWEGEIGRGQTSIPVLTMTSPRSASSLALNTGSIVEAKKSAAVFPLVNNPTGAYTGAAIDSNLNSLYRQGGRYFYNTNKGFVDITEIASKQPIYTGSNNMIYFLKDGKLNQIVANPSIPGQYGYVEIGSTADVATQNVPGFLTEEQISQKFSRGEIQVLDVKAINSQDYGSWLSKKLAGEKGLYGGIGGWADALISGLQWAGIAYGAGYMIGSMAGMSEANTQALSTAMAAGFGFSKFLYVADPSKWYGFGWAHESFIGAGIPGLVVGILLYAYMSEETEQKVVQFNCLPWQAPKGGADCEKCNKDKLNPCSEYRCKSLGQSCELVNEGTDKEMCISVNLRETDPPIIKPNKELLTKSYHYIYPDGQVSPPSHGFRIEPDTGGTCIKPFTPIEFGITTYDSTGQTTTSRCKIAVNHTASFDDMPYWMGGSNLYAYNHTERFSLPGVNAFANSSLKLENGKTMVFYIRCESKNDKPNVNPAEYMLRFCIDQSPDTTAPQIKATSILTNSCVAENKNSALVDFYTNEPAECRWGSENRNFDELPNNMSCASNAREMNSFMLYSCRADLTGIKRENTKFYIRCKDHPEYKGKNESSRNVMNQGYEYVLRSSDGLRINKLEPNGTIYSGISPASVDLYVETSAGCENGKARCFYSLTGNNDDYLEFFETNTLDGINKQTIYALAGSSTYYIKCVDAGGNVAINTTSANVELLFGGPVIARAYVADTKLKILTLRKSECAYSFDNCDFAFNDGVSMPYSNETVHYADVRMDKTYYIKCRDEFATEGAGCSIILKPQQLL